jgi:hypothetical protein
VSGELQRGPDISVTFEVWRRIKWSDGTVKDWHSYDRDYDTLEEAREKVKELPVSFRAFMERPEGTAQYRIRQAITILEWLE